MALYWFPTRVDFGAGVIQNLSTWVRDAGERVLLVTDPGVVGLPLFTTITDGLTAGDIPFEVFSGVHPDPRDTDIATELHKRLTPEPFPSHFITYITIRVEQMEGGLNL